VRIETVESGSGFEEVLKIVLRGDPQTQKLVLSVSGGKNFANTFLPIESDQFFDRVSSARMLTGLL
jgi:aspartokinase-like uncharacterized kinase